MKKEIQQSIERLELRMFRNDKITPTSYREAVKIIREEFKDLNVDD